MFSSNYLGRTVEAIHQQGLATRDDLQRERDCQRLIAVVQKRAGRYVYSAVVARFGAWMQRMGERLQTQTLEPRAARWVYESEIRLAQ